MTRSLSVMIGAFRILLLLAVAWGLLGFLMQRHILFPGRAMRAPDGMQSQLPGVEVTWLDTPGGKIEAWFVPAPGASAESPAPAVLVAHGNAELIDTVAPGFLPYPHLGVSLLLVEYPGYGRCDGAPTERSIADTMSAAVDYLLARPDVDPDRLVYHGRSLGTGAVCTVVPEHPPAALVLQSAFTSVRALARDFLLPGFLVRDPFDNEAVLAGYDGPVLLLHGTRDTIVPPAHAAQLARVARDGTLITYDAGHNDFPPDPRRYWKDIQAFLEKADVLPP
jgi:hypothetical protein